MKIILISNPTDIPKEHDVVNALMEKRIDYFHVRKPGYSKTELENYLKKIKSMFYRKISIHNHYSLIEKYNLGGIHIPEKARKQMDADAIIKVAKKRGLNVSTSSHSIADLEVLKSFSYIFLSPVFDSISKPDYPSAIDLMEFMEARKTAQKVKVIALGGIDSSNATKVKESGFDGLALLGYIWSDFEKDKNVGKAVEKIAALRINLFE